MKYQIIGKSAVIIGLIAFYPAYCRPAKAISKYQSSAVKRKIDAAKAVEDEALGFVQVGDTLNAIDRYKKLVSMRPSVTTYHLRLAEQEDKAGFIDQAETHYRLGLDDSHAAIYAPESWLRYGEICLAHGEESVAREQFTKVAGASAIFFGPAVAPDLHNVPSVSVLHGIALASFAYTGGWMEDRYKTLQSAYKMAPNSPFVCYAYANILHGLGQYADARLVFDRAIQLVDPSQRDDVRKMIDRMANTQSYSEISVMDARTGIVHKTRLAKKLRNLDLSFPMPTLRRKPIVSPQP